MPPRVFIPFYEGIWVTDWRGRSPLYAWLNNQESDLWVVFFRERWKWIDPTAKTCRVKYSMWWWWWWVGAHINKDPVVLQHQKNLLTVSIWLPHFLVQICMFIRIYFTSCGRRMNNKMHPQLAVIGNESYCLLSVGWLCTWILGEPSDYDTVLQDSTGLGEEMVTLL